MAATPAADRDGGTVTAEVAVLLPALALLTALCVAAVGAVAVHVRCLDAARTAARGLARGEPVALVDAAARDRAPSGARVSVTTLPDGLVSVDVRAVVRLPGGLGTGVTVGGAAVAALEPSGPAVGPPAR